jgi:glutamyl-tRNA synthetase
MVVGRLAPSPTGAQHLGNARTFLLAWLSLRSQGGKVILRIEDLDSPRTKPWAAQQAIDDLRWLGLDWDEGPDVGGSRGPYFQTARQEQYREALRQLIRDDKVYPCTCSRKDVAEAASAPHWEHEGPRYPGTCSERPAGEAARWSDRPFSWRWRSSHAPTSWEDMVVGSQSGVVAEQLGDFVIAKGDQTAAYQLAVVLDDVHMGVTEVVRGDDLLPSTFRQLEIYRHWDWPPPRHGHVPLVVGPDGRRLAKRHGDTRLATLRASGVQAEMLVGWLAWTAGLRDRIEPARPSELLSDFSWSNLVREPCVFTEASWKRLLTSRP